MKKLVVVLLLLAIAGYCYLPYRAIARFEQAMQSADTAAISELVDFPAMRASVKEALKAKAMAAPGEKQNLAAAAGSLVAGAFLDKMVDEMVTPEMLAATLKMKSSVEAEPFQIREKSWAGLAEMTARGVGDALLVFRLTNGSWKLVGVREPSGQ